MCGCDIAALFSIPGQQEDVYLPGMVIRITNVGIANDGNVLIYAQEVMTNGKNMEADYGRLWQGSTRANNSRQGRDAERTGDDLGTVYGNEGVHENSTGNGGEPLLYADAVQRRQEINTQEQIVQKADIATQEEPRGANFVTAEKDEDRATTSQTRPKDSMNIEDEGQENSS